ncbi:MAG: hypothetical protein GVY11_04150 [Gammaproteobacteria bacterium]|nr:hypothetical protein [Gammaproteobacteria bacterium]
MTRITLLACAVLLPICSAASDEPVSPLAVAGGKSAWWGNAHYTGVARWMIEHADVEMRAAGLAFLSGGDLTDRGIEPEWFMAEVESILDSEPTGAVVYMIARGCQRLDLLERCSEAGVPEAVERLDGGNVLAMTLFHDSCSPAYRQALISAERVDAHYPEVVSTWFEALVAREPGDMEKGLEFTAATTVAQAIAIPALQPITDRCRGAVGRDEALDQACQRLSEQMRTFGRTMLIRAVGFRLAAARAEQMGNEALAEEYDSERATMLSSPVCPSAGVVADVDAHRRVLDEMRSNGEISAFRMLCDEYRSSSEG